MNHHGKQVCIRPRARNRHVRLGLLDEAPDLHQHAGKLVARPDDERHGADAGCGLGRGRVEPVLDFSAETILPGVAHHADDFVGAALLGVPTLRPAFAVAAVEDEVADTLGVADGELDRRRAALRDAEQHDRLRAVRRGVGSQAFDQVLRRNELATGLAFANVRLDPWGVARSAFEQVISDLVAIHG